MPYLINFVEPVPLGRPISDIFERSARTVSRNFTQLPVRPIAGDAATYFGLFAADY